MSTALAVMCLQVSLSLPVSLPIDDAKAIGKARSGEIERLLTVARTGVEKGDPKAAEAIRSLGVMRAVEAVPFLVQNIINERPVKLSQLNTRFAGGIHLKLSNRLPAVYALGKIGGSAHGELLNRLAKEGDVKPDLVPFIAIALSMSLGADDAIALINARADRAKNAAATKRLRALADWIDKHERGRDYD